MATRKKATTAQEPPITAPVVFPKERVLTFKRCAKRVPVPGKKNQYQKETDYDLYLGKLAVACTVFPNLNDKELQDSYKVMGADALLKTMLTPGEYAEYLTKIQEVCGFDTTMQDEVDEAKN